MTKHARSRAQVAALLIMVLVSIVGFILLNRPTNKLIVIFFDVGQGDSIYIKSPSGIEMLIDAGADKTVMQRLGRQMTPFDRDLDIVLATHPDKDHIGGIPEVLKKYRVSLFIESGSINENGVYEEIDTILRGRQDGTLSRKTAFANQKIDLGSGVVFKILHPQSDVSRLETNEASIVGVLTYGDHSILLTGDAGVLTEYSILDKIPTDLTLLKVGHHGSDTSTSFELLEKSTPKVAILSLGANNSYGHPHKKVVDILSQFKIDTYRTDLQGSISFVSDGETYKIKTTK